MSLNRFWFDFYLGAQASSPFPADDGDRTPDGETDEYPLSEGAGVTAYDEQDALSLLRERVGPQLPPIVERFTDVAADRRALRIRSAGRVGNPAWRGVWFPIGARGPEEPAPGGPRTDR